MTITLYEHPLSPYAQKVKIVLREKGLAFEAVLPQGMGAGGATGAFVEANPRAEVPALVDGEVRVFDSTVILEYLEDAYPEPPLRPGSAAERARVRMLEEIMDTHFEAITWGLGELSWFRRAEGAEAEAIRGRAALQLTGFYGWLERQLGEMTWFNGAAFGWGDIAVAPFVNGAVGQGHAPAEDSRLAGWLARANERPSVAKAREDIAEWSRGASLADVAQLVETGLFKREYRDHRLEWMVKSGGLGVVLRGVERGNIRFAPDFA
ncbi:MAG TPA: glutathione S-transferase family protein [Phenylobacterium sp.]|uniref:glutathione S-transferase family protein n=1 Tax=Phenylobacterium sp. TaxID=1871053 RepID=UPI002B8D0D5A|nr:glutathione S-transferase family protein [Phenylobacterium sp.]HSV03145.1 glutathione S-transferase family protein [Phenylobacterium sp.]